jgi:hypothetical protein
LSAKTLKQKLPASRLLLLLLPCLLLSSTLCLHLQLLYLVGLPFPLRWTVRAAMQLLHQHTRRKIRMCRATDVPRRLPSQLRSHKLSLAAGLDGWAFLETQSYVGGEVAAAMDSGGYFTDAAGGLADAGSAVGAGSVVGSELDPYTPRTPKMRAPGARFRWRRRTKELQGGGVSGGGGRQQLRVRLLRHGALVLSGVVALMLVYLLVLRQLSPVVAVEQPLIHRLAAGLRHL